MNPKITILLAEDDPNDVQLISIALRRGGVVNPIHVVEEGQQAIDYLRATAPFDDRVKYPFPGVIILDIKMPRRSGLEVLQWLNENPDCSIIPSIVLSASAEPSDVTEAYRLGASTYFQKPGAIDALTEMMRVINLYWGMAIKPPLPNSC